MALPGSRNQREYDKFVEDSTGNVAVRTVLTDASGNDLARAEDAAHTTGDSGIQFLAVRNDTLAALAGTDGDYSPLQVDANGALFVTSVSTSPIQIEGYDSGTDSSKVFEVNPLSEHHVEETLADVTNGADGTYYYYVDMDGYRGSTGQLELNGGSGTCTVTVEATLQDDGTAAASCTYQDVTQYGFTPATGAAAASFTADAVLTQNEGLAVKYLRYKVVASTGGADDADWTIYHKKQY